MTQHTDHLGPIDFGVIEFDGNNFDGRIAAALIDLIAAGTIRIIDLAVVTKDEAGDVASREIEDVEEAGPLKALTEFIADIISEEDLIEMAAILEPNTTALLAVWENCWALELAHAIRSSGGQMVASGRLPAEEIAAALEASA